MTMALINNIINIITTHLIDMGKSEYLHIIQLFILKFSVLNKYRLFSRIKVPQIDIPQIKVPDDLHVPSQM